MAKAAYWTVTDVEARKRGEQTGLDTLVDVYKRQVQFYTSNGMAEQTGKGGANYGSRTAYCLETQFYPDTANEPDFPSAVFGPDKDYHSVTIFRFE